MKRLFVLLVAILATTLSSARSITPAEFNALLPALSSENFRQAYDKTSKLLLSTDKDNSEIRAAVVYMHIYAAAGLTAAHQMTQDKLHKVLSAFIGERLLMPPRPCVDSSIKSFNAIQLVRKGAAYQGITRTTRKKGDVTVLCLETFRFTQSPTYKKALGKRLRCGGTLESIEVSTDQPWICHLTLRSSTYQISKGK